ncbi:hypothetical protein PV05_02593 [Exophiala xenobiotica]|uniref:Uncharacterized protein n=1 Tax=Exophiala xenobiotica TaxID=348802 RepID=A0A0D2EQU0_9EURO|nr:uncharacterized protein PV05_02593 [Exophiala xenobiotica]KIW58043.1 hypothetical protein PV05_02593 [Exophiala xenobiotica]
MTRSGATKVLAKEITSIEATRTAMAAPTTKTTTKTTSIFKSVSKMAFYPSHPIRTSAPPGRGGHSSIAVYARFTATEIIEITNFMFSDLTGPKAVERVASLVERYSQDRGDILDTRSSKRAEEVADHPDTPSQL